MPPAPDVLPRRIALVHEWFTPRSSGGAELVVQAIDALLTAADRQPQLAALVDGESRRPGSWLERRSVLTSPISSCPGEPAMCSSTCPCSLWRLSRSISRLQIW